MSEDVADLAHRYHEFRLETYPTWAHLQGDYRFADRFEEVGRAAEDRTIAAERAFAAEAAALPIDGLGPDDRITREISLAVSYGSPLVWCLDRLMDSQWGVGMYRLRGQLSEAEEMERRLGYT